VGSLILQLNDSLTVEAGRFDTLSIDILESSGTVRIPKAFFGEFSTKNNGEIRGIPLGENPPAHYVIRVIGFKDGKPAASYHISVSGSEVSSLQPIPLPAVELLSLAFDPPTLSLTVGETSLGLQPKPNPINASDSAIISLSDSAKATVLPGNRIRAEAEGTVLVTATSLLYPNIKATLSLSIAPATVKPPHTSLIIVTSPSRDTLVKSPSFTVAYTVDGAPKTKEFILEKEGRNRLVITETMAVGTDSALVFVDLDTKAPVVRIISPATGTATNKSTLQIEWTVDSVAQIQETEEDISTKEGEIVISRTATDAAGNTGTASVTLVRDVTKPIIAFTSPKNGDTVTGNPVPVVWTVDGQPQATQLTETFSGVDGEKSITRKATDAAGNSDSATIKIILDASKPGAPKVMVDAESPTKITTPTWTWTSIGTGTGDFQFKLDNSDFSVGATATKTLTYKPAAALADGIHTLYVREMDAQGAWGPAGSSAIEIDTKPAIIEITSPVAGAKITSSLVTVIWTVDGGDPQTSTDTLGGADGERTITRTGVDKAGNAGSGNVKVILDLAKPAAPIFTTPATAASSTRSRKPTWTWKSGGEDGGAGFRYQLGSGTPVQLPGTTFTPATDLADGTYVFKVAEKDAAGNWSTDAVSTVTIKGSAPAAPTMTVNAAISNAPKWTWSGTSGATFGYKLKNAESFIAEGTATSYQPTTAQMGEGLQTVCVAEKDVLGYGPESCQNITVDRTKPVIAITSDVSPELMVTSVNPVFTGTAGDANLDRVECKAGSGAAVNATITAGIWSCAPPMADGDFNVTFTAFDKAANTASAAAVTVHKRSKVKFVRKGTTGGNGTSWAKAYGDIRDVLKAGINLNAGDEVWISAGTYEPVGGGEYKFTSNTSVIGGFSNTGAPFNRSNADPKHLVQMAHDMLSIGSESEPITKLTIFGITFNGKISTSGGLGLYIDYSKEILIEKCSFINSSNYTPLFVRLGSGVTIKSSHFLNNYYGSYGAIMVQSGGQADIIDCTIKGNISSTNYGGGISVLWDASVTLTNCTLSGNKVSTVDDFGSASEIPMNIYVDAAGRLSHSGLILPEGGSTVSGTGIISPPIP